jgi:hypothetical protein
VVSFTPRPLCSQGKSPWCPLNRRLGGPQSRSGRGGEEITSSYRDSNPPIIQPVAHTTELSRLFKSFYRFDDGRMDGTSQASFNQCASRDPCSHVRAPVPLRLGPRARYPICKWIRYLIQLHEWVYILWAETCQD